MNINIFVKKSISLFMIVSFCFSNTMLAVNASDITGVTPTGNVYNIEGQQFSGSTQFRQYDNFDLSKGDVANLIYKDGYQNFVNLVDSQVNINGIVNTMQNNNFFNGHAIFVSPLGVVVGASGVLNVGSLSILTPSVSQYNTFLSNYSSGNLADYEVNQEQYKNLIQDSQGNILVNGKIIAREGVNLYGSNITVKKDTSVLDNNTAGIIAGYKGTSPMYDVTDAEAVFNSLVSSNQINANGIELDSKGNINLVANKTISVTHSNLKDHSIIPTLTNPAETVDTSITLDNAVIGSGSDVIASSVATHTVELQASDIESGLKIEAIATDPLSLIGAHLNENFEGARANSKIDIVNNSKIYSKNNTSLTSNAVTNFVTASDDETKASRFIYAIGTETSSKINIQDSVIEAGNDFISKAFSENKSNLSLKNNLIYTSEDTESDNNMLLFVNQTTKATTSATADNSKIKAKNISLISRNYNNDNLSITTEGQTKDRTGVAITALIKNQQIDTTSEVKNKSELTSQNAMVDVTSQNLAIAKNNVKLSIDNSASSESQATTDETGDIVDGLTDQMNNATLDSTSNTDHGRNAIDEITGSSPTPQLTANSPLLGDSGSNGTVQIGGSLLVNRSNINTTAKVDNSAISGAANTYILANAVDLTSNIANSSTKGSGSFGSGMAIGVNYQNKSTLADILNDSDITSDKLFVNATTELPMNQDALKFAIKMSGLDSEITLDTDVSNKKWEISGSDIFNGDETSATGTNATNVKLAGSTDQELSYDKFFHNIAKSSSDSDKVGLSGSFIYNSILNNTEAKIDSSTVNIANNGVTLNSINSVTNYNAAGAADFIFSYLTDDTGKKISDESAGGSYAIGGAVLVNFIENNANSIINDSNVIATASDINIKSSNEASYVSASAMGSKGTDAAIDGSIVVQTIEGTTNSQITNSTGSKKVSGNNVNVIAGEAEFNPVNRDDGLPTLNSDTGLIDYAETGRSATDKVFDIVLSGAMMSSSGSNESSGVAVGASVNVNNINRTLNASIENSIVSAINDIIVKSDTNLQGINVAIAGDFEGGVSTKKSNQINANKKTGETNGAQSFTDYGGWITDLDNAVGDDSTLTTVTATSEGYLGTTTDAVGTTIYNALNNDSTQEALSSTTSKAVTKEVPVTDETTGEQLKDSQGNPITSQKTTLYNPDADGYYVDEEGHTIEGKKGNVKVEDDVEITDLSSKLADLSKTKSTNNNLLTSGNNDGSSLTGNAANSASGKNDFSVAVAGSVNVYTNKSNVQAKVSNSTITAGKSFNVISNHTSELINNANCETKAGKVGVGGAVNVGNFKEKISSLLSGSTVDKADNNYDVNITANDYNKVTDEAISNGGSSGSSSKVAVGGSFNVSVDESSAVAQALNSQINDANDVIVSSDNYIDLYKKAGFTGKQKDSNTGIGIAGNINILRDTSESGINVSSNIDSNNLYVKANSKTDSSGNDVYNTIKSVAIAGDIITGSSTAFSLPGAFAVDIIDNEISAYIIGANEINSTGDIVVNATSNMKMLNLDGALSLTTTSGAGAGIGAIVEVYNKNITSKIENTNILSSKSVDVSSTLNKELKLLVANLGINTDASVSVNVNGIVNVIEDSVNSYITNSDIKTSGKLNLSGTHNVKEGAITLNASGAKSTGLGGTAVVNIFEADSESVADATSTINAGSDISVSNCINEYLDVNIAAITASSGSAAIAASVNTNLITNITKAILSADVVNSSSVSVNSSDIVSMYERNVLVAGSGGAIGLAGLLTLDIINKEVEATISDNSVSSTGVISAIAKSENAFGGEKNPDTGEYYEKEIGNIKDIIDEADEVGGIDKLDSMAYWQYLFNGSGSAGTGINETVVAKTIDNNVSASIENANITSNGVSVLASDYAINNALIGDIAASSGLLSIGGGEYINVLTSETSAKIYDGVTISSTGDIDVEATNKEVLRDIIVAAGGAGTVTINGAATVNIVKNQTDAIIGNNVNITNANNINIIAGNIADTESADVTAGGSGLGQIGGVFKFNQFKAKTNAKIDGTTNKVTINKANGDILLDSSTEEDFSAMMYSAGGSGTAAVNGVAVVNILDSETNSIIDSSEVITQNGKIDVNSSHDFNPGHDNISADLLDWMEKNETEVDQAKFISDAYNKEKYFAPLVTSLELEGSGVAAIAGNITSNNFYSKVNSKVYNSTISSLNGMNLDATQSMTTFDAMTGMLGAGVVSIVVNGVVNVIEDETRAIIDHTTVNNGGGIANAYERMNVNTGQFAAGGSAVSAIMTAVNVNVIDNITEAAITESNITGNSGATSEAESYINNMFVIAGGSDAASIMLAPVVNYFIGDVKGYIEDSQLHSGKNTVGATTFFKSSNLVTAGSLALTGAAINAISVVNDLIYNTDGHISGTTITDAISTDVYSYCESEMYAFAASLAVTAVGAAIPANGIVNVYDNKQNSYITESSIEGGSVSSEAENDIITNTSNGSFSMAVEGAGVAVSGLVDVFNSITHSYMYNTSTLGTTDTTITANSYENIINTNFGVGICPIGAGVSGSALVNVIENDTLAYIDTELKTVNSTGKMLVQASDLFNANNLSGVISGGAGDVAGSVNVNELNNVIKAYVDTESDGSIVAGSLDVLSSMSVGMMNQVDSIAIGIGNIAGDVAVTTIGGNIDIKSFETTQADLYEQLNGGLDEMNDTADAIGTKIKMNTQQADGVVATIGGNVKTKNDINVEATNLLKGYKKDDKNDDDTYRSSNHTISVGGASVVAGVHYTNVKYNTNASIVAANVESTSGNITVNADNNIKVQSEVYETGLSGISLDGIVAYCLMETLTEATVGPSTIKAAGNLDILSNSYSNVVATGQKAEWVPAVSYTLGLIDIEEDSKVKSKITGNVDIKARDINIITTTGADLSSSLDMYIAAAIDVKTVFDTVETDVLADALIDAVGDIQVDDLNITLTNKGFNLQDTYSTGTATVIGASADESGAIGNLTYTSGINSTNLNIKGYNSGFANNINIYNGVSDKSDTVAGNITTNMITDTSSLSLVEGSGTVKDAISNLITNTNINSGSGTIKTKNMNVSSLADRTAKIDESKGSVNAIDVSVYTLRATTEGNNTINFGGTNIISEALNILMDDNANSYTQMLNNGASIVLSVAPLTLTSTVDTTTDVTLGGTISAGKMTVNNNANRYAYCSDDVNKGSLVDVTHMDMDANIQGDSSLTIGFKTSDDYKYANAMDVSNNINNVVETYLTEEEGGLVAVQAGHCDSSLAATNTLNIDGANINSTGDITIGVLNKNNAIRRQSSTLGGVVAVSTQDNNTDADITTTFNLKNSTISANTVNLFSKSYYGDPTLGTINNVAIKVDGFVGEGNTTVQSDITQNTNLNIINSTINAIDSFVANVASDSYYHQSGTMESDGFVAGSALKIIINAKYNNTFELDKDSSVVADYVYINTNSSNDLYSQATTEEDGFATDSCASPDAQVNLYVKNYITNNGLISAGELAEFDFMTASTNNLEQQTYANIDAAMPFGGVDGSVTSSITNNFNVPLDALVISNKDVIANFMEGTMNITSDSSDDITCRMCFGIPIDCSDDPKHEIYRTLTNNMTLNGEIVAQSGNQKYFEIGKDGKIVENIGFANDDYKLIAFGKIIGEKTKEELIASLNNEISKLKLYIQTLNARKSKNNDSINSANAQKQENDRQLDYLDDWRTHIDPKQLADDIYNYEKGKLVDTEHDTPDQGKLTLTQYDDIVNHFQTSGNASPTTEDLDNYMTQQGFRQDQKDAVLDARDREIKFVYQTDPSYNYQEYHNKDLYESFIMSDSELNSRIKYYNDSNDILDNEISILNTQNANIDKLISNAEDRIDFVNKEISVAEKAIFPDKEFSDYAYVFSNIENTSGQIQLNNIRNTSITGTGKFIVPECAIEINNYSPYSSILTNIVQYDYKNNSLIIDSRDYYDHANTNNNVNCNISEYPNETHDYNGPTFYTNLSSPTMGTRVMNPGITIRNYFDHNNPNLGKMYPQADIYLLGTINTYSNLYIWNESGDIEFGNTCDAITKEIYATQNSVGFINDAVDIVLNTDDVIYAGKNVVFKSNSLVNNGSITAGRNKRTLTIEESMLSDLVKDPATDEENMINIALDDGNTISPYLNETNDNIKALYKDGEILVFGIEQEGGQFISTNTPTGTGTILTTNGYSDVDIINNTTHDIIIRKITNNYMNESVAIPSMLTVRQPVYTTATTDIISKNGAIGIDGYIQNAYKNDSEYGSGVLNLDGKKISVADYIEDSTQQKAIEAYGNMNIIAQNGIDIAGFVYQRNGNSTIDNNTANSNLNLLMMMTPNVSDGINLQDTGIIDTVNNLIITNETGSNGINLSGSIFNNGNTTITNNAASDIISSAIIQNTGNLTITNSDGAINSNGTITNGLALAMTSTNGKGISITGDITNNNGNMTLTNGSTGKANSKSISITGNIDNKNGTLDITNYGSEIVSVTRGTVQENVEQGISILGTVANNGKTNIINNNGIIRVLVEGTSTSNMQQGKITTKGGKLTINNTTGSGITIEGEVKNEDNAIEITNGTDSTTGVNGGISIVNRNFDDETVARAIVQTTVNTGDAIKITNYGKLGIGISGTISNTGSGDIKIDNLSTDDAHGIVLTSDGVIENSEGSLYITNHAQEGGVTLVGKVDIPKGDIIIKDDGVITHGITINEIRKETGDIIIYNEGVDPATPTLRKGITIYGQLCTDDGNIYIYNEDSDISFGFDTETTSYYHKDDDSGYIVANKGNIVITLKNGSLFNNLTGTEGNYSNYDMASGITGNAYRTLIVAKGKEYGLGNLTISVTDGDIGRIGHDAAIAVAGDINSNNIDYRDSINVNVEGAINLYVRNKNTTDNRVVNLRAKQSDLNIRHAFVQGDMILSAPDWKQNDDITLAETDPEYYEGYSVNMTGDGILNGVTAKNLTVIASDKIGSEEHPFTYIQTQNSDKTQTAAFEAENDIYLRAEGNQNNTININQIVTKQGDLNLRFFHNSDIQHIASEAGNVTLHLGDTTFIDTIGSNGNLSITQDKGDLFIKNIGGNVAAFAFNDILNPHDKISLTCDGCIPQTIDIEVNGDDSTLLVYNTYVKGANNGAGAYDEYGNRLTDVKLAANEIITSATDIPTSTISTKKNPNGFVFTLPEETIGIKSYGEGSALSLELTGSNDSVADTIITSVNSDDSRGVILNKLYSNDAYINTLDKSLSVVDGYINNYAELRTGRGDAYEDKFAIVDNDYRRLIYSRENPASIQLFTALTGNFNLGLDDTILMTTNAPVAHYEPHHLVNRYSDENSFYNLGMKETAVQQNFVKHKKDMEITLPKLDYNRVFAFDVVTDTDLVSNVKIYKISRTGASIQNDGTLKVRQIIPVNIKFNDEDIDLTVNAKVVRIENGVAEVKFVDMSDSDANKLMYRYFRKANTKNPDLTMNTKNNTL